jgi:NAD(P)-dependent dehydrogenase (short-subunit alcohol dehydrogenase family)
MIADFSDPSTCHQDVEEAKAWAGSAVSILVNNVGIQHDNNTPVSVCVCGI